MAQTRYDITLVRAVSSSVRMSSISSSLQSRIALINDSIEQRWLGPCVHRPIGMVMAKRSLMIRLDAHLIFGHESLCVRIRYSGFVWPHTQVAGWYSHVLMCADNVSSVCETRQPLNGQPGWVTISQALK